MLGMNRSTQLWRTVVGIAAACVLLGIARGWAQAILNDLPAPLALRRGAVAVGVSLFWLPVCLTVGATWPLTATPAVCEPAGRTGCLDGHR
jgi:hypothetical protein